ncbi:hypothetical protein [Pedobacter polysacchareus]|uniref:hypothetical protein n=1 Tax=Pedobacter polysacchareus TaxID=2861973 RepID=UPI001C990B49|nr:hypothetical protein [Pedobacter polysacchareus]
MKNYNMDYLNIHKHALSKYFERIASDERLFASHISLCMALFYFSNGEHPASTFQVSRPKLMRFSRIKSIATYHKNIKDLTDYGYIEYKPSWHPVNGTQIRLMIEIMEND